MGVHVKHWITGHISTYGEHDAWYVDIAHSIYRTLNGTSWTLLK